MRELTDENIFKSMYILNKSAKKSRDTQKKANSEGNLTLMKRCKTRKDYIYKVKHLAMEKLVEEGRLKFVGIHKQDVNKTSFYLAYYKSDDGFSYHRPATKEEIKLFKEDKITSMTVVPATIKHKQDIKFKEGMEILLRYIEKTPEEVKQMVSKKFLEK